MNKRLRSKMEELAKGYSHRSDELVEDGYMTRPEMFTEGFKAAIDLVEASVKDLYDDEYVQQVGTWKIIQRLEEQLKSSEEALEDLTEVWHLKMNDYKKQGITKPGFGGNIITEYILDNLF